MNNVIVVKSMDCHCDYKKNLSFVFTGFSKRNIFTFTLNMKPALDMNLFNSLLFLRICRIYWVQGKVIVTQIFSIE